jgi:hypothetical protein
MITNIGKKIIGKYLIGQAPAYASYIAIGCGPTPLNTNDVTEDLSDKKSLDFEVFRVPISSKGFIKEDGVENIVFKAEMPTNQRFQTNGLCFSSRIIGRKKRGCLKFTFETASILNLTM